MAGKGKAPPSGSGSSPAKAVTNTYAQNAAFNQFRDIVAELLK
jgi:hypothetical protein